MKVSFLGDISLNDNYIELYKEGINPFEELEPLLNSSDLVIGNLECMAMGEEGENLLKQPRLTTTAATLNYLKNIHLKVACLAHNHVYDHLEDGFRKTIDFLNQNELLYLGAGFNIQEAAKPLLLTQDEITVALLNYVTNDTNPNIPFGANVCLNMFDLGKCKQDISQLKKRVNHIVLSLHWGGRVEGGFFPDWNQPMIARELIDAGADLIIGHHSHTIQPYEVYKGKYIFYSLGNFCFSDYWFEGELNTVPKRGMVSAIIGITFTKNDYIVKTNYFLNEVSKFSSFYCYRNKVHKRNQIFKFLLGNKTIWNIYYLHKQLVLPFVLFFSRKDLTLRVKLLRLFRYINRKFTYIFKYEFK